MTLFKYWTTCEEMEEEAKEESKELPLNDAAEECEEGS